MGKRQETSTAILDEALQVASTIGFNALTIGHLADRSGMSKGGLFAHFRSKEQLQLDTLEHARRRFIDRVARPTLGVGRGEKRVRKLFQRWPDSETETLEGGCVFVAASSEFDDQPGPMRDALARNQQDWLDMISTVAATAVSEGDFRVDLHPDQFAFELNAVMLGYHHAARLLQDRQALERTRQAFESLLASARA